MSLEDLNSRVTFETWVCIHLQGVAEMSKTWNYEKIDVSSKIWTMTFGQSNLTSRFFNYNLLYSPRANSLTHEAALKCRCCSPCGKRCSSSIRRLVKYINIDLCQRGAHVKDSCHSCEWTRSTFPIQLFPVRETNKIRLAFKTKLKTSFGSTQ